MISLKIQQKVDIRAATIKTSHPRSMCVIITHKLPSSTSIVELHCSTSLCLLKISSYQQLRNHSRLSSFQISKRLPTNKINTGSQQLHDVGTCWEPNTVISVNSCMTLGLAGNQMLSSRTNHMYNETEWFNLKVDATTRFRKGIARAASCNPSQKLAFSQQQNK